MNPQDHNVAGNSKRDGLKTCGSGQSAAEPQELGKVQRPSRKGVGTKRFRSTRPILTVCVVVWKNLFMQHYKQCVSCGTTERRVIAKGLCRKCYDERWLSSRPNYKHNWYVNNVTPEMQQERREQSNFSGNRQAALERDNYRCVKCGLRSLLTVHHKDGNGRGSEQPNNTLDNLETLCRCCHAALHSSKDGRWSRHFDCCRHCGTTDRNHNAKGLCWKCYREVKTG